MSRPRSPLAEAKRAAVVAWGRLHGGEIVLSSWIYDRLREEGLSRAEVNSAADSLVQAGEAELVHEGPRVIVRLVEEAGR